MPERISFRGHEGGIAHFVAKAPTTLLECLKHHFKLSQAESHELLKLGAVYHNKRRLFEDTPLAPSSYLRIHLKPKRFLVSGINWNKTILFDERDFLVANKPHGIPVHAMVDNNVDNLLFQLRQVTGLNLLVTHRLDVPVGGLVLLAKNPRFQTWFNRLLAEGRVQKFYEAQVAGEIPLGLMVHYMQKTERAPKRVSREPREGWDKCELKVLSSHSGNLSLQLLTGRTHQIRAQLSEAGSPILGDKLYGSKLPWKKEGISLMASGIQFPKEGPRNGSQGEWVFRLNPPFFDSPTE